MQQRKSVILNMFFTLPKLFALKNHAGTHMCMGAHTQVVCKIPREKWKRIFSSQLKIHRQQLECLRDFSLKAGFRGVPNTISKVRFAYN